MCGTLDFWMYIIQFSEKNSFGARNYVTMIDDVLEKEYIAI